MRKAALLAALLTAGAAGWVYRADLAWHVSGLLERFGGPAIASPHARYAAAIGRRGLDETDLGRAWLEAGATAVAAAIPVTSPFTDEGHIGEGALAWRFEARRGQRIGVEASFPAGTIFVDLLHCTSSCQHVAGDAGVSARVEHEAQEDRELVLRIQPELLREGGYSVAQRAEATLEFPIAGLAPAAAQSLFGAERDRGARTHEGVDIFAPRGTPVVAAAGGLITGSTSNRLGGNVVWVWVPGRRLSLYYAHLDAQAVSPGDRVSAGDVLGWVGTTGNARGAPPHLHFGVYARPGGAVDPLPYICSEPCASSRGRSGRS